MSQFCFVLKKPMILRFFQVYYQLSLSFQKDKEYISLVLGLKTENPLKKIF